MSYRSHITLKTDEVEVELRDTWIDPDNDTWAWKVYLIDPSSKMLTEQDPGDGLGMSLPRALIVAAACLSNPGKSIPARKYLDAACACINVLTLKCGSTCRYLKCEGNVCALFDCTLMRPGFRCQWCLDAFPEDG